MPDFEAAVAGKLRNFLVHEVLEGDDSDLDDNTSLITSGIMNSLVIMKLMAFVEERYGVALSFKQLTPDNLQTVRSIAKMIVAAGSNNE
jgi:acyl carrier protein